MSLSPKVLQGNKGTTADQINAGVVYKYWSRSRVRWGEEVSLGAVISGYPEGTSIKLTIYEADEGGGENDDFVAEVDCTLENGLATGTYTVDFEDPDADEGSEYEFYFLVEIDGKVCSWRDLCPLLFVDLSIPIFSE